MVTEHRVDESTVAEGVPACRPLIRRWVCPLCMSATFCVIIFITEADLNGLQMWLRDVSGHAFPYLQIELTAPGTIASSEFHSPPELTDTEDLCT